MENTFTDSDLLKLQSEEININKEDKALLGDKEEHKFMGAYTDYNGLDVKKLKNPVLGYK